MSPEDPIPLKKVELFSKSTVFLIDKCAKQDFLQFQGRVFEWLLIEACVFSFLVCTMIVTMSKSRFMKVGIDNTEQFEDLRMNHVVKIIISFIDTDTMENPKHFYVNKQRMIRVEGVALKIKLN